MTEEIQKLRYALAKQVKTVNAVSSDYGEIELSEEMQTNLSRALEDIIKAEISRLEQKTIEEQFLFAVGKSNVDSEAPITLTVFEGDKSRAIELTPALRDELVRLLCYNEEISIDGVDVLKLNSDDDSVAS